MVTRGGLTPAEAWDVTLDDALELVDYWAHTPPLRDLVSVIAQSLGWDGSTRAQAVEGEGQPALEVPGEFED